MGPLHLPRGVEDDEGCSGCFRAVPVFDGPATGLQGARRGQLWLGRDPRVSLQRRTPTNHTFGSEKVGSPSLRAGSPVHRRLLWLQPYHIRAMAEELADIRGGLPVASNKSDHDLAIHRSLEEKGLKRYKNKGCLDYWMEHQPATGRPLSTAVCCPLAEPAVMHPGVFS